MHKHANARRFGYFVALLGIVLLAYLIVRTGPLAVAHSVKAIGWGFALVLVLGGAAHLLKTWAWRLTFLCDLRDVPFRRTFGLRLISEAIGTFGLPGQVIGDTMRVSLLGSSVPVANSISSVTLDRALYTVTSGMVSVTGIVLALLLSSLHGFWRVCALLFVAGVLVVLLFTVLAMRRRWPVFSGAAQAIGRLSWSKKWFEDKRAVVASAEDNLFRFYHENPGAFWGSFLLNAASHALAVVEVYLLLRFMGVRVSLVGALVLEALTKLINMIGALNPGNVGSYEGGNMIITKLIGVTSAAGLTLGLCRRARALFWAGIGALCMMVMSKSPEQKQSDTTAPPSGAPKDNSLAVLVLANTPAKSDGFDPYLARVGTLPILLRAIITAQGLRPRRTIVYVDQLAAKAVKDELHRTKRMPDFVQYREAAPGSELGSVLQEIAATSERLLLLCGDRTYQPALMDKVKGWTETSGALALTCEEELVGVYVLSQAAALDLTNECPAELQTLEAVHSEMERRGAVVTAPVSSDTWQGVGNLEDQRAAERKLDKWLVKPTDGLFARMNRRVSIPISRQMIRFPVTPNMVTFLTLAVGVASGMFFALGGYWYGLLGAALSVWASILDGCDGEVARLKLQSSAFGCWLETICDYLYYLLIFSGMAVGLARPARTGAYLVWGAVLIFGAVMSFFVAGYLRSRMAGDRPERFLAVWQAKADKRRTNPLLYLARHTEFIIRRCFLPYAFLVFALFNITKVAFIMTAVGANLVWMIALYSRFALAHRDWRPA